MTDFIKASMARHKVPRYIEFVEGFPMNAAGKVLKYKMREAAAERLGLVGAAITFVYIRFVTGKLFRAYREEQFLAMYGMLTGTASTGVILLREIDGKFKTPAADNLVYQNFPAMVFGFPLMLLAAAAPKNPVVIMGVILGMAVVMNVILFRSFIFRRKKAKV